jgi:hypothetical protein
MTTEQRAYPRLRRVSRTKHRGGIAALIAFTEGVALV